MPRRLRPASAPLWPQVAAWSLLAGITIALLAGIYLQLRSSDERDKIMVEQAHHVQIQAAVLQSDLRYVAYTLGFLRDQLMQHGGLADPFAEASFTSDIYSFMRDNDLFDQTRFLDSRGMERIRVDHLADGIHVARPDELQFKGQSYYVKQMQALKPNQIYISRLDLNMEHGKVEMPLKPTIRFGLKLTYPGNDASGLLIINHSASDLLKRFEQVGSNNAGQPMLLNSRGYWLFHPDHAQMWGFMWPDRADRNMAHSNPERWQQLNAASNGQFEDHGDLISFATMRPFASFAKLHHLNTTGPGAESRWKVVSRFPAVAIAAVIAPIRERVILTSLIAFLFSTLVIFSILRMRQAKRALFDQVQQLSRGLIEGRDQERSDIARRLHDEFGQIIAAVQIQTELVRRHCLAGNKKAVSQAITQIDAHLTELQQAVRNIIAQTGPGHLASLGLTGAVEELCKQWQLDSDLEIDLNIVDTGVALPKQVQMHLFHIIQEGVTNIIRHAGASHARIELELKPDAISIVIEDDGCGMDMDNTPIGNGLAGIRERSELLHGQMAMTSSMSGGMHLSLRIPDPAFKENP